MTAAIQLSRAWVACLAIPVLATIMAVGPLARVNAQFGPGDLYKPGGSVLPPHHSGTIRWRLGVLATNTSTGLVIRRVDPGSAAEAAGLQPRDVIITVGGQQVGYVNDRLYDLSEVLEARANRYGNVVLLIYDAQRGSLRNVEVRAGNVNQQIQGAVIFPGQPPRGAQLIVKLVEYTRAGIPPIVLDQQVFPTNFSGRTVNYQLTYDPQTVARGRQYGLIAEVRSGGLIMLTNVQPQYVVLTDRGPIVANIRLGNVGPGTGIYDWREQMAIIEGWYREYLGRSIRNTERAAWEARLRNGESLAEVQAYLLGSHEYYDRYRGNTQSYLAQSYENLYKRRPSALELSRYERMMQGGMQRVDVMKQMSQDANR